MGGRDIDEPRTGGDVVDDQPLAIDRHATDLRSDCTQQAIRWSVARVLDGHLVPGPKEDTGYQVDGLLCPVRDDHVVGSNAEPSGEPGMRRYPRELKERAVRLVDQMAAEGERHGAVTRVAASWASDPSRSASGSARRALTAASWAGSPARNASG